MIVKFFHKKSLLAKASFGDSGASAEFFKQTSDGAKEFLESLKSYFDEVEMIGVEVDDVRFIELPKILRTWKDGEQWAREILRIHFEGVFKMNFKEEPKPIELIYKESGDIPGILY